MDVSIYLDLYEIIDGRDSIDRQTTAKTTVKMKRTRAQPSKKRNVIIRTPNPPAGSRTNEERETFDAGERRGNRLFAIDDVKPSHTAWHRQMQ